MSLTPDIILPSGEENVFPYPINHSALFDGVGDYLSFTPAVEGNQKTFTFKTHWKSSADEPANQTASLLAAYQDGSTYTAIFLNNGSTIQFISTEFSANFLWGDLLCTNRDSVDFSLFEESIAYYFGDVYGCADSTATRFQSDFCCVAHVEACDDSHDIVHWRFVSDIDYLWVCAHFVYQPFLL